MITSLIHQTRFSITCQFQCHKWLQKFWIFFCNNCGYGSCCT